METTVTILQLIPVLTLNFHGDKQLAGVSFLTSTGLTCSGMGIQNLREGLILFLLVLAALIKAQSPSQLHNPLEWQEWTV